MHQLLWILFYLACLVFLSSGRQAHNSDEIAESQRPQTAGGSHSRRQSGAQIVVSSQRKLAQLLLAVDRASAFRPSGSAAKFSRMDSTRASLQRHEPIHASIGTAVKPLQASLDAGVVAHAASPGQAEKQLFQCDPSCELWQDVRWDNALVNLQAAASIVAKYIPGPLERAPDGQAVEFWGKHAARLGYFISNALAGVSAFGIFGKSKGDGLAGIAAFAILGKDIDDLEDGISGQLVNGASGLILDTIMTYEQDWQHIAQGQYAMPWDMTAGHRQTTLPYALRQSARFVEEAVGTLERRSRGSHEDRKIWMESAGGIYPEYYKTNFHYQTDGWMSAKSAAVYEVSTETLFLGRHDAMQRTSLVPLQGLKGVDGRPAKILEVACGTGRFATFIRDNHPTADLTCVDLSPFYLEAARENDEYWRNFKSRGRGEMYAPAHFLQAAAEAMPFEDGSFDAVVFVYLFHEMPESARATAAAEMARVLRPGGTLVLTDSLQRGDRPALATSVDAFTKLNEPHVSNYFETHLADLFMPHGLVCGHKYITSVSKTLSFTKPAACPN